MKILNKQGAGRPLTITDGDITKLELAFSYGCSLVEALEVAGISRDSYFRLLKRQPEFRHRFKVLQEKMTMRARAIVAEAIYAGDVSTSKWYLERRDPEFQVRRMAKIADKTTADLSDEEVLQRLQHLIGDKAREMAVMPKDRLGPCPVI